MDDPLTKAFRNQVDWNHTVRSLPPHEAGIYLVAALPPDTMIKHLGIEQTVDALLKHAPVEDVLQVLLARLKKKMAERKDALAR